MSANELLEQAQFVVDAHGKRTAVVLDIGVWEQLLRELGLSMDEEVIELTIDPTQKIRLPGIRLAPGSRRPEIEVTVESAK
jgi:hypothetical protein